MSMMKQMDDPRLVCQLLQYTLVCTVCYYFAQKCVYLCSVSKACFHCCTVFVRTVVLICHLSFCKNIFMATTLFFLRMKAS